VVQVADAVASSAQALAAEIGCNVSGDWESLVARSDVDAVVVATPHKYLSPITVAALQAGKFVFCEKPMARTLDEAELILRAAGDTPPSSRPAPAQPSNGRHNPVTVGYTLRHHPAIVRAKELIAEGLIGEPFYVRGRYGHGGRSGYEKEWRGSADLSGGGVLLDLGVHLIDLSPWFLGEFNPVMGFLSSYFWANGGVHDFHCGPTANPLAVSDPEPQVEDNAFLQLRTCTRKVAFLHASWTEWKNLFSFEIVGQKGFLAVEGRGGNYGPERLRVGLRRVMGDAPQIQEISFAQSPESGGVDPASSSYWDAEWAAFVDAVQCARSRRIHSTNGHSATMLDARQNLEIVNAVYQSARGVTVFLEPEPVGTKLHK